MTASEDVDVVIVGSGPTGATYARVVSDSLPDARVLLLDAGPALSEPPGIHVNTIIDRSARAAAQLASQGPSRGSYEIPTLEERDLAHSRAGQLLTHPGLFLLSAAQPACEDFPAAAMAAGVGGMAAHWFGCCPRPAGSERIGFLDPTELEEAESTARGLLSVSADQFAGSSVAARLERLLGGLFDAGRPPERRVQPMPLALSRRSPGTGQSGPAVILGPLLSGERAGFELRPDTLCRRVLLEGDQATGVELEDLRTGRTSRVDARVVVVAADALRTPQLLYASGVRPRALGRHLNEHPYLSLFVEIPPDSPLAQLDEPALVGVDGEQDPATVVMPTSGVTWVPFDEDRFPFHAQLAQRGRTVSIGLFLPKDIDPENRVELSDTETDWQGLPAMRIHYSLSAADLVRIERGHRVLAVMAEALGQPLGERAGTLMPGGTSLHYQGTVRIGPMDDGTSVCDRHGRVWGTENLFCGSNGLIPTSTAANPTVTSVALSVLGGQEVARRLRATRALQRS